MRLKGLDLNLLIALDILLEEKNVSRSAERLHLSQPAASSALGRLRDYFNDDLLVMHGKRMIPTSYAQSLIPEVKRILGHVEGLISMSAEFDPLRSERVFTLMASDYITSVLVNPMVPELRRIAPGVGLDIRLPEEILNVDFERGEVDLMLVPDEFLLEGHPSELLFEDRHVVLGCRDNTAFDGSITSDTFFDLNHIAVTLGPSRLPSFTERTLAAQGRSRNIDIYSPYFSAVPWMLMGTNRIAVLQERLAKMFASVLPLKFAPMPFDFPIMKIMLQYHGARAADQGQIWLRDWLRTTAEPL